MKQDIHKLGAWLEKVCQEGVAIEHKILDWKLAERQQKQERPPVQKAKAS